MANIKLKPNQPIRRYVGVDITNALDTVAWGHLWNATFGWKNLLWELDKDPTDSQRRTDKAHTKVPIVRLIRTHKTKDKHKQVVTQTYSDTCIMPQGIDAKGTDKLWPGSDSATNISEINAGCKFMQTFILSPNVNKALSSLNDSGEGIVADVVYISSHGSSSGNMSGEVSLADTIFDLGKSAESGGQFSGPGWILLSNCNTLKPSTHGDWLKLMTGPNPLRGIVGFQDLCPLAPGSVEVFAGFIRRLAEGKTFINAWAAALKSYGIEDRWIVLCNENAVGDTISDWNANKLKVISPGSKVFMFDKDNPAGKEVISIRDPFEAFWSKGGKRITIQNQSDATNKLQAGDSVSITVKPPAPATTFSIGDKISITLIYIRTNYPTAIDITKMFTVVGQSGTSPPSTANLNNDSPGGDDSWELVVNGTPSEVVLSLVCKDFTMLPHPNMPLWLRINISRVKHDFIRNGSILVIT